MGIFGSAEQRELSGALSILANAYLQELTGADGMFEAMVAGTSARVAELAKAVRGSDGPKGIKKAKREAMSYLWHRMTEDPSVSMRSGSPAKVAYERFESRLNQLMAG